jgi:NADPH2:quinone reductase
MKHRRNNAAFRANRRIVPANRAETGIIMLMRAWQVHEWGEPESMVWAEVPLPEPGSGEVRIRNRAVGLNFFDILQVQGRYQMKPDFPFTPGAEIAGEVDAVGPEVKRCPLGSQVVALCNQNGYAEYTVVPRDKVWEMVGGFDFATSVAMPIVYHTAFLALEKRAQLQRGEWLLVHAGASGVGMAAIQLGRAFGAQVIATAGSDAKLKFAEEQGARHVLRYSDAGWVDEVKRLTKGRGVDVVFDPVGGDVFELSTRCMAPGGRLLVIGFASGRIPTLAANRVLLKNLCVLGVFWGGYTQAHPEYIKQTQHDLEIMLGEKMIAPVVSRRYPLAEAPRAMRDLADRKILGKAALEVG